MRRIRVVAAACALLLSVGGLWWWCGAQSTASPDSPRRLNFGSVVGGTTVVRSIDIWNRSPHIWRITGFRSSCSCIAVESPGDAILPERSMALKVSFSPTQEGVARHAVDIFVDDGADTRDPQVLSLQISAEVQGTPFASPQVVRLDSPDPGDVPIELSMPSAGFVLGDRSPMPVLHTSRHEFELGGRAPEVRVTIDPPTVNATRVVWRGRLQVGPVPREYCASTILEFWIPELQCRFPTINLRWYATGRNSAHYALLRSRDSVTLSSWLQCTEVRSGASGLTEASIVDGWLRVVSLGPYGHDVVTVSTPEGEVDLCVFIIE